MADTERNEQSDFMIETIKKKPVNKRKLLRRTMITASMAVVFGLIACLTFLILEPVFNNWLYPEEEKEPITFADEVDETEEMLPEDMLTVDTPPESTEAGKPYILDEEQIGQVLSQVEFTLEDYKKLYASMSEFAAELSRSIVTVTGAKSDTDWFNDPYESESYTSGVIVAEREEEIFILVDRKPIIKADSISVTFCDGYVTQAELKGYDKNTNLAIVCVDTHSMLAHNKEEIKIASLGSSNGKNLTGSAVIALGSPIGVKGSVCYGNITSAGTILNLPDANFRLLTTNIVSDNEGSGVLFNLNGQLIGVLCSKELQASNTLSALGISELKKVIEKMSNEKDRAYLGISGIDVSTEANLRENIPLGAYVLDVKMDSPAMNAGIQRGDIIVEINEAPVLGFDDYMKILLQAEADTTAMVKLQRQVQGKYKEMQLEILLGIVN